MPLADKPFEVHETVTIAAPVAAAVTQITLRPWCENYHPDTPKYYLHVPLAAAAQDAMVRMTALAPNLHHALLVHAIEYNKGEPVEAPKVATLRQYISRSSGLGTALLTTKTPRYHFEHLILIPAVGKDVVPRWVWPHLAAQILYPACSAGVITPVPEIGDVLQ